MLVPVAVLAVLTCSGLAADVHRLTAKHRSAAQAWRQFHRTLTRRHELLGDLSHAVRGYLPQQRVFLDEVAAVRAAAIAAAAAGHPAGVAAAEQHLGQVAQAVYALAGSVRLLTMTDHYRELLSLLHVLDAEAARQIAGYNALAADFNRALHARPTALVAVVAGYRHLSPCVTAPADGR